MKSRTICIFMTLFLALAFTTAVSFADDDGGDALAGTSIEQAAEISGAPLIVQDAVSDEQTEISQAADLPIEACTVWDSNKHWIGINAPSSGKVYYYGVTVEDNENYSYEDMDLDVTCADRWADKNMCTVPRIAFLDKNGKEPFSFIFTSVVPKGGTQNYSCAVKDLSVLSAGDYTLEACAAPVYADLSFPSDWREWGAPCAKTKFSVRELKSPTNIKAKAGKGKVTITYKKAAGAQRYVIYRSIGSQSVRTKVGTTSSTKFVDKKVKKGERYYYIVFSHRPAYGLYSKYTKRVRSGTVK